MSDRLRPTGDLGWLVARPVAHRGLHDRSRGIIENTAGAFAAAVAAGYPIECDLQLSGDGEAMVFHDATLDRLTQGTGPLRARTCVELQSVAFRQTGDRMQTLGEMLHQVDGEVPLVIELKSHWDGSTALARRALEVLEGYRGRFSLMSFDPDIVAAVRRMAPAVARGIVADRVIDKEYSALALSRRLELRHLTHLPRSRPHFLSYEAHGLPCEAERRFHEAGLPVISWTIRSETQASRARRYSDQITFEGFLP